MQKSLSIMLALLLLILPALAQDDSQDNNTVYMRVAHFSDDAALIDVYVDGELALPDFSFRNISDWLPFEAGTHTIEIVTSGDDIEDAIYSDDYDLDAGDWATLAVTGGERNNPLTILVSLDDLNNIPEGDAHVTVFHTIADFQLINVFAGEIELVADLDSADFESGLIAAGEYNFSIQTEDGSALSGEFGIELKPGHVYLLALVGTADEPLLAFDESDITALTMDESAPVDEPEDTEEDTGEPEDVEDTEEDTGNDGDTEGTLIVRAGHFAVSAPDMDVYLDGELYLEDVRFGDVTEYFEATAGVYNVALVETGDSPDNVIYEGEITLSANTITLIVAIGFVEDNTLELVTAIEENTPPDSGDTRIAFYQAIPTDAPFELRANGETIIPDLWYPAVAGSIDGYASTDLPAAVYQFVIAGDNRTLNVGNITTGSGRVYLIVSAGTPRSPFFFLISDNFPVFDEE